MRFFYLLFSFLLLSGFASRKPKAPKTEPVPIVEPVKEFKTAFPQQAWAEHALKLVEKSKLPQTKVKDPFCPEMNNRNWVHLLAAMTRYESNFKPTLTYQEKFKNSKGEFVISTGLLQLSYESSRGYGFPGITTEQLKDPFKNLEVGVAILSKLVAQDGVITSDKAPWKGGARYWSVLRSTGKVKDVRAFLQPWCEK